MDNSEKLAILGTLDKNGQSRETDNIGYARQETQRQKKTKQTNKQRKKNKKNKKKQHNNVLDIIMPKQAIGYQKRKIIIQQEILEG